MLRNPMYAGAYVFRNRQVEEVLDDSQRPVKRVRACPRKDWHVLLRDHHEGYLSWETFEKIQRRITGNRRGGSGAGAPREGGSLLAGLVLCGHSGPAVAGRFMFVPWLVWVSRRLEGLCRRKRQSS